MNRTQTSGSHKKPTKGKNEKVAQSALNTSPSAPFSFCEFFPLVAILSSPLCCNACALLPTSQLFTCVSRGGYGLLKQ